MAGKETTKSGNKAIIFMNTHIEGRLKIVKEVTSLKKKLPNRSKLGEIWVEREC